ncbi:DNA repair protein RadA [Lactiplantibacillus plantarum]|nr:outer membrane protein assembly factor BamE [Lactiplantibacillus plantarum]OUT03341.1 DNA repair protein RadA [Lactiplantibacillus plantarum]
MTAIINTVFLISFIAFLYFIGRGTLKFLTNKDTKHSFKYGLLSLLVSLVFIVIGIIFDPAIKSSSESDNYNSVNNDSTTSKKSPDSTSQSHSSKSSSSKKYDFSKVKLGMTKSQVTAIMGKPTDENSSTLMYGSDDLDFQNDKLFDGSPDEVHKAAIKKR